MNSRHPTKAEIIAELHDLGQHLHAGAWARETVDLQEAGNRAHLAAEAIARLPEGKDTRKRFKPLRTRLRKPVEKTTDPLRQRNDKEKKQTPKWESGTPKPKRKLGKPTRADYKKERELFLTKNPLCQCRSLVCTRQATDVHHMKGRAGKLLTDANYFMAVCRQCHDRIERHKAWAYQNGYLINRAIP